MLSRWYHDGLYQRYTTTKKKAEIEGIPQAVVQELVGHDSEQMSALFTHVGREALERATAALPEI